MNTRQKEEEHYGDFKKCVAHIWSFQPLNMAKYLRGYEQYKDLFENPKILNWMVWTGSNPVGVIQEGYQLDLNTAPRLADRPSMDKIRKYQIAPVGAGTTEPLTRLIVTVIPRETVQAYDDWKAANADLSWLENLPPAYSTISTDGDLLLSPDRTCLWSPWKKPGVQNSPYHPDSYFEVRTQAIGDNIFSGRPAHQACYDENKVLIEAEDNGDVISAGSADRSAALWAGGTPTGHLSNDVKPFIWALQIDGNPAEAINLYRTLSDPIMFQGVELEAYAKLRPAEVPAGVADLGECFHKPF